MNDLQQMIKQRDDLNQAIEAAQEEQACAHETAFRDKWGVQVVCTRCCGHGFRAPVDADDGPDTCNACGGMGCWWAVRAELGVCIRTDPDQMSHWGTHDQICDLIVSLTEMGPE